MSSAELGSPAEWIGYKMYDEAYLLNEDPTDVSPNMWHLINVAELLTASSFALILN